MVPLRLVKRRELWLPTWRGWLLLLLLAVAFWGCAVLTTVPFLAVDRPLRHGALVVEGWLPDYALEQAKHEFEGNAYDVLLVTGVPIEKGFHISAEKNYAGFAAATLRALGVKPSAIIPVPCREVPRNRTYATARQVRAWLDGQSGVQTVDVFTLGVHARRSWLLYQKALGPRYRTGIISAQDERFDRGQWWITSSGFRTVTDEVIAYVYAKLFFFPKETENIGPEARAHGR